MLLRMWNKQDTHAEQVEVRSGAHHWKADGQFLTLILYYLGCSAQAAKPN
jgi:hypothetical protein